MSILSLSPLLEVIQFVTVWLSRLYIIGGEILTATALLWGLKLTSDVIEKLYKATQFVFKAGVYCGVFYYTHLHETVLSIAYSALINTVKVVAFSAGYCERVYRNRGEIVAVLNTHRNTIGSWFVYTSPQIAVG